MKILALDLGDRWVGSAISDGLGITCRPYETVEIENLSTFLLRVIPAQDIRTIIVGYPKTFSGGQSAQTEKIEQKALVLKQQFACVRGKEMTWILWDERLSSKRAQTMHHATTAEAKRKSHSIAAAFILQNYLDGLAFTKSDV